MTETLPVSEGRIPFSGAETWYRIVGEGEEPGKLPLLCLHGGPGALHDYLEPLERLAGTGRRVVFYDQIGCGRSWVEKPADFWTVELFVREVQAMRDAFGLDRVHLFGSSWGGMLAMEYALTQPAGLASLVLSSSPASIPLWAEETNRLKNELPEEVRTVLDTEEVGSPAYEEASMAFYERHVCRVVPFPDYVQRTFAGLAEHPDVYMHMQGPNEFLYTGNLKDWNRVPDLPKITVPTFISCGQHDELTPACALRMKQHLPNAELKVFPNSSHMPFYEEPHAYYPALLDFLGRHRG